MWLEFVWAVVVTCALLYIPGSLVLDGAGFKRSWFALLAPLVSVGALCITFEVIARIFPGIPALAQVLIALALCGIAGAFLRYKVKPPQNEMAPSIKLIALFLVFSFAAVWVVYLSSVTSPENVCQSIDMLHHVGFIRSMTLTDVFSSFKQGYYSAGAAAFDPWQSGASVYPSAYLILCAAVSRIANASVAVCINAVNVVMSSVVFPLGILAFLYTVFNKNERLVFPAALITCTFTIFPWGFFIYGPLYCNLAAFACVPIEACLFMMVLSDDINKQQRILYAIIFVLASAGLALLHPNAIFTCAILLVPYLSSKLYHIKHPVVIAGKRIPNVVWCVLMILVCCLAFVAAFSLPAIQSVASFNWGVIMSSKWAFLNALRVSYVGDFFMCPSEEFLGLFIILGSIWVFAHKKYRWCFFSYALIVAASVVNASFSGPIKQLVGGIWFTDPYRFGAMESIFAIPLATLGFGWLLHGIARLFRDKRVSYVVIAVVVGVFVWVSYMPHEYIPDTHRRAPLGTMREEIRRTFDDTGVYTPADQKFVEQIQDKLAPGAIVINAPDDGSAYAYGLDGLNTYYRCRSGYGSESEIPDSQEIRLHLNEYETNPAVQKAIRDLGGPVYVVRFNDPDPYADEFEGIYRINDDTPGFKLVARDGDMALYEVEPIE